MFSFSRFIFGLMMVCFSMFVLNAIAQTGDTSGQPTATANQSTNTMMTATTTTKMHHKRMKHMVNINAADVKVLAKVRGIGKRRAVAIVAYRTKNGSFASVEDLKNVMNAKGKPAFTSKGIMLLQKHLTVGASS